MKDERIDEVFAGAKEMVKAALDLEITYNTEISRTIITKNKNYRFSVKLDLIKEDKKNV